MDMEQLKSFIEDIAKNDKEYKMTPRQLINAFGYEKRTKWNLARVNGFLEENKLETSPNYQDTWFDGDIMLKHKKKATSKMECDPIHRIKLLPAANKIPTSISRDAQLSEAITLMMMHNYSQLPVMSGQRNVIGVITWETIGYGLTNGCTSKKAIDYINKDVVILDYETPLLQSISIIIENQFALIKKSDNTISGIVTVADISSQFINDTEPFLLIEQIENHIRQILDSKFLLDELREFCKINGAERKIDFIDDLTFGDYVRIIEKPEHWERLNLSVDRSYFIQHLEKVREIRNIITHFNPDGITTEQREILIKMSKFLIEIQRYL